jgi:FPC/CPF motif-containing protein YcgG
MVRPTHEKNSTFLSFIIFVLMLSGIFCCAQGGTKSAADAIRQFKADNPKYSSSCIVIIDDWFVDLSGLAKSHSFVGFTAVEPLCGRDATYTFLMTHWNHIKYSKRFKSMRIKRNSEALALPDGQVYTNSKGDRDKWRKVQREAQSRMCPPCWTRKLDFKDIPKSPFSTHQVTTARKAFKDFILKPDSGFSCAMGKIAVSRNAFGFGLYEPSEISRFMLDFHAFTKKQIDLYKAGSHFTPFVAAFPTIADSIHDDLKDWKPFVDNWLRAVHDMNIQYFPASQGTPMTLAGMEVAVQSGHPRASRNTRRFPLPIIVIQPLQQFWLMEHSSICLQMLKLIHDLEFKNDFWASDHFPEKPNEISRLKMLSLYAHLPSSCCEGFGGQKGFRVGPTFSTPFVQKPDPPFLASRVGLNRVAWPLLRPLHKDHKGV